MGADGREGARLLKQGGSQVWAQDEASCVIYGMPMAVVKANLADAVYGSTTSAGTWSRRASKRACRNEETAFDGHPRDELRAPSPSRGTR